MDSWHSSDTQRLRITMAGVSRLGKACQEIDCYGKPTSPSVLECKESWMKQSG